LAAESAQFDLGDVQPAAVLGSVVDFQALGQAAGLSRRKRFVERGQVLGVEVVHDQAHLDRGQVTLVEHGFDEVRPVLPGAALGHRDMAAGQRVDFHKQRGDAVAWPRARLS
jgi:hypothetical protein